jgi:hypothetical protein
MFGKSIYVADNPALVGGSPQAVHEQLWAQGRRRRLQIRAGIAAAALIIGTWAVNLWFGLFAAVVAAGVDALWHWRQRAASSMWRRGQRGERRTALILRTLEWRGYAILHGRKTLNHGQLDHLVIGPTGVMIIENQAVPPETVIAAYRGTLYVDERPGRKMAAALREKADETAAMLRERFDGGEVPVDAIAVVYGGEIRRGRVSAEGITLLPIRRLPGWIMRQRVRYTPEEVAALANAATTMPISQQAIIVR